MRTRSLKISGFRLDLLGGDVSRGNQATVIVICCHNLAEIISDVVRLHHADDIELRRILCKVAA